MSAKRSAPRPKSEDASAALPRTANHRGFYRTLDGSKYHVSNRKVTFGNSGDQINAVLSYVYHFHNKASF